MYSGLPEKSKVGGISGCPCWLMKKRPTQPINHYAPVIRFQNAGNGPVKVRLESFSLRVRNRALRVYAFPSFGINIDNLCHHFFLTGLDFPELGFFGGLPRLLPYVPWPFGITFSYCACSASIGICCCCCIICPICCSSSWRSSPLVRNAVGTPNLSAT